MIADHAETAVSDTPEVVWHQYMQNDASSAALRGQYLLSTSKSSDIYRGLSAGLRPTRRLDYDGLERRRTRGRLGGGVRARPTRISPRPHVFLRRRASPVAPRPCRVDRSRPLPGLLRHRHVWRRRQPGTAIHNFTGLTCVCSASSDRSRTPMTPVFSIMSSFFVCSYSTSLFFIQSIIVALCLPRVFVPSILPSKTVLANFSLFVGWCSSSFCFHPPCPKPLNWIGV